MNKQIVMGHVTAKPELTDTKGGTKVCRFNVAANRPKRNGEDQGTDFFRVTTFGKTAENCAKYLDKGAGAAVKGRIQTGSYENKDGNKVNTVDIVADKVTFTKGGNENDSTLIGRLTADPDISYTATSNTCVARFTVAIDRPKRNGEDQGADFIRVVVYGKTAENCEKYLSKGRQVAVSGELHLESYENKEGVKVNTHEVVASNVEFLGSGNGGKKVEKKEDLEDLPDTFDSQSDGWDDIPEDDDEPF